MFNLLKEKNSLIETIEKHLKNNGNVYIYGCAEMGLRLARFLDNNKYEYKAFCVDKEYYKNGEIVNNHEVVSLDEIEDANNNMIIVSCFHLPTQKICSLRSNRKNVQVIEKDLFFLWSIGPIFDWNFYQNNKSEFDWIYDRLEDDYSKLSMTRYFEQKLTGDFNKLKDVWRKEQYFDKDIIPFNNIKCFVDCGAYDGDSFLSFVKNYENAVGKKYDGKGILFEPDILNYEKMRKNLEGFDKISCLKKGVGAKNETLHFSMNSTSSGIVENGETTIDVVKMDEFIKEPVDFIKMDIEGVELDALNGARTLIKKNHPILTICVYHKREDLITIPKFIYHVDDTYKFYIRAHSRYSQELVLYAI
ncbi:MAG: FkbM family methyltransferase [Alphaproteobacteria bacterium]|nr:FkbM family methyltransferase [Alphaproteobacteria bacterium]